MKTWQAFLDSLNTSGGHIFVLLVIAGACGIAYTRGIVGAGAVGGAAVSTLYYAMRGGSRQNDAVPNKPTNGGPVETPKP